MAKYSKEIKESKQLVGEVAREISAVVYEFVFRGVMEIVQTSFGQEKQNAIVTSKEMGEILKQINSGNIVIDMHGGLKIRRANAKVTSIVKKLGGKYDRRLKSYKIDIKKYPNLIEVQAIKNEQIRQNLKRIDSYLAAKQAELKEEPKVVLPSAKVESLLADLYAKTLVAIPERGESLGIVKKVDEGVIKQYKEEYLKDTLYPIKDMESRAVERMRKRILPLVMEEGYRQEDIAEVLVKEFGETERHAMFLARQEAMLIKSKMVKDRALDLGYTEYVWQTVMDKRARDKHKEHNGKTFSFLSPPEIDDIGTRGNPGEAFNCRCKARVITSK